MVIVHQLFTEVKESARDGVILWCMASLQGVLKSRKQPSRFTAACSLLAVADSLVLLYPLSYVFLQLGS